ncbi:MAG TPA: hypothetical protein VHE99_10535 [Gammaproteobacteria bacterium]|nr:hypothetical protein [Gammaproteobacteria bacterium]
MSDEKIADKKKKSLSYIRVMEELQNEHLSQDFDLNMDNPLEPFMNLQKYLFSSETPPDNSIAKNFITGDILTPHFPTPEDDNAEQMDLNALQQFLAEDEEEINEVNKKFNQENSDLSPEMELEMIDKQLATFGSNSPISNYFPNFNDTEQEIITSEDQADSEFFIDKDPTANQ